MRKRRATLEPQSRKLDTTMSQKLFHTWQANALRDRCLNMNNDELHSMALQIYNDMVSTLSKIENNNPLTGVRGFYYHNDHRNFFVDQIKIISAVLKERGYNIDFRSRQLKPLADTDLDVWSRHFLERV